MYVFFEDMAVVALTGLIATLVFVASVVVVTVGRGIGAVLRISHKTASAGTREELLPS
jgi:hypothetical protein